MPPRTHLPRPDPTRRSVAELIIVDLAHTKVVSQNLFYSSLQSTNGCRGQEWEVTAHEQKGEEEGEAVRTRVFEVSAFHVVNSSTRRLSICHPSSKRFSMN